MASNSYVAGTLVRVTNGAGFKDGSGVVQDPTTVTLEVIAPGANAGTTYTYGSGSSIVRDGVGLYHCDVSADLVGEYRYRWASTGVVQAAAEAAFRVTSSL